MLIRAETGTHRAAVHALLVAAFPTVAEAELVDRLRAQAEPFIALVAESDSELHGHIVFSPVHLDSDRSLSLLGLAPLAVAPTRQGQGVGAALVQAGLAACREQGAGAVCVLGDPAYYGRFGFKPAHLFGMRCTYPAPEGAFMLLELRAGYLENHRGCLHYHAEFDRL